MLHHLPSSAGLLLLAGFEEGLEVGVGTVVGPALTPALSAKRWAIYGFTLDI